MAIRWPSQLAEWLTQIAMWADDGVPRTPSNACNRDLP
jgi:hypothetical protein